MADEDQQWLLEVRGNFKRIAGADDLISFQEFKKEFGLSQDVLARRYFRYFDKDGSGYIELNEFVDALKGLMNRTELERLHFVFDIFDENDDGLIERDELKNVVSSCIAENTLTLTEEQIDDLVDSLFLATDKNNDGVITFDELTEVLQKYPGLIDGLAISPSAWLKRPRPPKKKEPLFKWPHCLTMKHIKNNKPTAVFMFIFAIMQVVCFIINVYRYRKSNGYIQIARGCGMCLNLDCTLIVIFMMRRTLTRLRNTPIGRYLPIDESIEIHSVIGYTIFAHSVTHTLAHLGNLGYLVMYTDTLYKFWEYLFTTRPGMGWIDPGLGFITGDVLIVTLTIMFFCALPKIRSSGYFQVFFITHILYWVFFVFLIMHGPLYWYFFVVPGSIFALEKFYGYMLYLRESGSSSFFIEQVNLLPSKVTHLVITRPESFKYRAGAYIFLNIPSLTRFEWHPFTISSAPETDELWLHIRGLGTWTRKLHAFYKEKQVVQYEKNQGVKFRNKRIDAELGGRNSSLSGIKLSISGTTVLDHTKVLMDGPYGTPIDDLFKVDHAILLAAGIGVTPFAAVLQHMLNMRKLGKVGPKSTGRLKKIDFIWVNRNLRDFEWFLSLLTQLEMDEARDHEFDRFLDMHLFLTSAKTKNDLKGVALQMCLELIHQEEHRDLLTGLRTRTQAGRPNWMKIFRELDAQNHGSSKQVFYCGSPMLAEIIKGHCDEVGFRFAFSF